MKQFYPCSLYQYQLTIVGTHDLHTTKNGTISLDCNMGGCIVCFKQSHRDSRHGSKNTTIPSQNTVAQRSDFEMLLTNGL